MNELVVEVTSKDIKAGKRSSPRYCPIALGFKRANPRATSVSVFAGITWVANGRRWKWEWKFVGHNEVMKFIEKFDACGGDLSPFTFRIPLSEVKAL